MAGYSSSIERPVFFGKMDKNLRKLVEAGLELHNETKELMKEGVMASEVVKHFSNPLKRRGHQKQHIIYGSYHGIGLMEVGPPWMELTSEYPLKENMTFQVDTFLYTEEYGLRWEDAIRVTKNGVENSARDGKSF